MKASSHEGRSFDCGYVECEKNEARCIGDFNSPCALNPECVGVISQKLAAVPDGFEPGLVEIRKLDSDLVRDADSVKQLTWK